MSGDNMLSKEEATQLHQILDYFRSEFVGVWHVGEKHLNFFLLGYKRSNRLVCLCPGGMRIDQARHFGRWKGSVDTVSTINEAHKLVAEIKGKTQAAELWSEQDESRMDVIGQNGNTGDHYS